MGVKLDIRELARKPTNNTNQTRIEAIMAEATKTLMNLKRAANYSKLAFHKDGPKSYTRGQGALLKVIDKFGNGSLSKKQIKKILRWDNKQAVAVAKKACRNGYVTIKANKKGFTCTLTAKGSEILQKRFAAENRTANEILAKLSKKEIRQLDKLTNKIIEQCQEMGVDYELIRQRPEKCCKKATHQK